MVDAAMPVRTLFCKRICFDVPWACTTCPGEGGRRGGVCEKKTLVSTHCQVSYQLQLNSNISSPSLLRNFFVFNTFCKMRFSFHGGECTHCIDPTAAPPLLPSHLNQPNRMQIALPRAWGGVGGGGIFWGGNAISSVAITCTSLALPTASFDASVI